MQTDPETGLLVDFRPLADKVEYRGQTYEGDAVPELVRALGEEDRKQVVVIYPSGLRLPLPKIDGAQEPLRGTGKTGYL